MCAEGTLNLLSLSCIAPRQLTVPSLIVPESHKKTFCRKTNPSHFQRRGLSPTVVSHKVLTSPWVLVTIPREGAIHSL